MLLLRTIEFLVVFVVFYSPGKKKRLSADNDEVSKISSLQSKGTLAEDEELAMQLLTGF